MPDPYSPQSSPSHDSSLPSPPLHIPGAGTFIMGLLLASLSMLFLASIVVYLIIRQQHMAKLPVWPPPGLPAPPKSLWISTLVILATSVTIHRALSAARRDDDKKLKTFLRITFGLGVLFLILQALNWLEFYNAIPAIDKLQGPYLGMFFVFTGLHAAHVIGGLIPLGLVTRNASRGRYSRNFHPGVRYCAIYWHFLDIIWLALFITLMI